MMRYGRIALACFFMLVLQVTVTSQLPIDQAIVDVVLIAAIGAGLAAGPEAGAGVGFACGLIVDFLGAGPVGMTALVYTMVGYAVGVSQTGVLRSSRLIPILTAVVAAPIAVVGFALFGEVIGQHIFEFSTVVRVAAVSTAGVAVGSLPARALMHWAFDDADSSRMRGSEMW